MSHVQASLQSLPSCSPRIGGLLVLAPCKRYRIDGDEAMIGHRTGIQWAVTRGPSWPRKTLSMLRPWHAFLILGAIVIAIYFQLSKPGQAICYEVFAGASSIAILIGVRRYRPLNPGLWRLVAAGIGLLVTADLILNAYE